MKRRQMPPKTAAYIGQRARQRKCRRVYFRRDRPGRTMMIYRRAGRMGSLDALICRHAIGSRLFPRHSLSLSPCCLFFDTVDFCSASPATFYAEPHEMPSATMMARAKKAMIIDARARGLNSSQAYDDAHSRAASRC